jgi:hypothetical protein
VLWQPHGLLERDVPAVLPSRKYHQLFCLAVSDITSIVYFIHSLHGVDQLEVPGSAVGGASPAGSVLTPLLVLSLVC